MKERKCVDCEYSGEYIPIQIPGCIGIYNTGIICRYSPSCPTKMVDDWCYKFKPKEEITNV